MPAPWTRRLSLAGAWIACAGLAAGWLLGARPAANTRQVYVESTLASLAEPQDLEQKKTALREAWKQYRQATDLGEFLLVLALVVAAGAAAAGPIWSAIEARSPAPAPPPAPPPPPPPPGTPS